MKKISFGGAFLVFLVFCGRCQTPTPEDIERQIGPFRDFLVRLIQTGKLPEVKTNEHGTLKCFRVTEPAKADCLTKKMRSDIAGCKDVFFATLEIPLGQRHLLYLLLSGRWFIPTHLGL